MMSRAFKWIGITTVVFAIVPFAAILVRDVPGMIREVKIDKMGLRGGWRQAH